jgi:hypothetical protein
MSLTDEKGAPGGFVCLVDGDGNYNLEKEKMDELIQHIDPNSDGSYTIVGIMGCQSTGKSTLLNRLFGTQFAMMDQTIRRGQTTKGIWLDAARNTSHVMIADLEGTDSGERGEDRTTFERQTILYALSICEVLIINMWETDIGRYTASNHGILKTVFEVNMQLFKSKTKTQLLFIIRDYNEDGTPFSTLRSRLLKEMQSIWDDIIKPDDFKNVPMTDCFDFKFTYLPHYIYRRDKFEEMAKKLQEKFTDPNSPDSFFDTDYHHEKSRAIPARDFAQYSANIWETIKTNQDLNLPTQREMLATYRCDELVTQILAEYNVSLAPLRETAATKFYPTLGSELSTLIQHALEQYDISCEKYIQDVVQRKRIEFKAKLLDPVHELISLNIKMFIFNHLVQQYEQDINKDVTPDEVCFGIMDLCQKNTAEAITQFNAKVAEITHGLENYGNSITMVIKRYETEFMDKLIDLTNILRKSQLHALVQTTLTEFDARADAKISDIFGTGAPDMWQQVGNLVNLTLQQSFDSVNSELNALSQTEQERINTRKRIVESVEFIVFDKAQRFVSNLPIKIRHRFESLFVYSKGQLRVWKGNDDPRALFESARDESLQMLRGFSKFELRKFLSKDVIQFLTSISPTNTLDEIDSSTKPIETATASQEDALSPPQVLNRISSITPQTQQQQQQPQSQPQPQTQFNVILISRDDLYRIETDFERNIQGYLQNAIIEVERVRTQTGLPPWVWALFLFLGYDEILWAMSNPFVLFFLLMIGIGIFVLYQLHMLDAALTIGKAIGTRLLNEVTKAIEGGNVPQQQQQQQTQQQTQQQQSANLQRRPSTMVNTGADADTISTSSNSALVGSAASTAIAATNPSTTTAATPLASSASPSLDLDQVPQEVGVAATISPTPRNGLQLDALSGNSLRNRRPNYGTMTMNKRQMAQMFAQGQESGLNQ